MIKVIASDLDGTMLNSKKEVSEELLGLVDRIRKAGYKFGIATGRPLFSVQAAISDVDKRFDFAICNNGAAIYDFNLNTSTYSYALPGGLVRDLIIENQELNLNPILYLDNQMITAYEDAYNRFIRKQLDVVYDENLIDRVPNEMPKVIFSGEPKVIDKALSYHQNKKNISYKAFKSQAQLLEFMDPRIDKEKGLETYLDTYGIDLNSVMSFGDNDNDYEMLRASGFSVAMKNATEKTMSVADEIAASNDEDGVYKFLLEYFKEDL